MELAAVIFVLIMLAVAYLVFRLLKRAVKLAARAVIVLLILVITFIGAIALWSFGAAEPNASDQKPPAPTRRNR